MIIDLHTHTYFSDGLLGPAEVCRRAKVAGYSGIALTDHIDHSNYLEVLIKLKNFKIHHNSLNDTFKVLAGGEITHTSASHIGELTNLLRGKGADLVIVHGETLSEPVERGTNRAAIEACVDILAHPGLISLEDAALAAKNNVALEITTRRSHAFSNGHLVNISRLTGAKLVINNDAHSPSDFIGYDRAYQVLLGSGLNSEEANRVIKNTIELFNTKLGKE